MTDTDIPLDVVTGLLFAATVGLAVVAVLDSRRAQKDAKAARDEQDAERRFTADEARRRFKAQIVLEISDAFETFLVSSDASHKARIRARLAALPMDELGLARALFGPSSRKADADALAAITGTERFDAAREQIRTLLEQLTAPTADQTRTTDPS